MEKQDTSFKHFDLPVNHLDQQADWIPPKERDPETVSELKELPTGSLIARKQEIGIAVAAHALYRIQAEEGIDSTTQLIAAATYNTAWYNHAKQATDVMRRRLLLPNHAKAKAPITAAGLINRAAGEIDESSEAANLLRVSVETKSAAIPRFKKRLGRQLGNASLVLASAPEAHNIANAWDTHDQQYFARRGAMKVSQFAATAEHAIGANPTLAQFADRFSPAVVYLHNNAPQSVAEAITEAQDVVFEQAA